MSPPSVRWLIRGALSGASTASQLRLLHNSARIKDTGGRPVLPGREILALVPYICYVFWEEAPQRQRGEVRRLHTWAPEPKLQSHPGPCAGPPPAPPPPPAAQRRDRVPCARARLGSGSPPLRGRPAASSRSSPTVLAAARMAPARARPAFLRRLRNPAASGPRAPAPPAHPRPALRVPRAPHACRTPGPACLEPHPPAPCSARPARRRPSPASRQGSAGVAARPASFPGHGSAGRAGPRAGARREPRR